MREREGSRLSQDGLQHVEIGERALRVEFSAGASGVTVRETFDAESTHSVEEQREGWQAILNNFARHVEGRRYVGR